MRPGIPGQLQLNPFKVRQASMLAGKKGGGMPRIAGIYPSGNKGMGSPMMMPGLSKMGGMGRMPMTGMGLGMPKLGMGMGAMGGGGLKPPRMGF
jgi:hypothetical protein